MSQQPLRAPTAGSAAGVGPDAVVTGEAVAVDLPVARIPTRVLALAVDLALQLAALTMVLVLAGVIGTAVDEALAIAITLTLVVLVIVGLPAAWETLSRGRSLGKLMMGLRVVRDDGGPTRFRHSLVRALFMFFVDLWLTSGSVGLISSLASAKGKRVGDHFAGTVVVRERVPVSAAAVGWAVPMPPPLAGWAAGVDLARLPDDLALTVRQYLGRAAQLDPTVRGRLGPQLATQVAAFVAPPAPAGTPADAYLAAVVAERGRRAWLAQQRQMAPPPQAPIPVAPQTYPAVTYPPAPTGPSTVHPASYPPSAGAGAAPAPRADGGFSPPA
jgi:uncharacterized RDD family membrane protein YckC